MTEPLDDARGELLALAERSARMLKTIHLRVEMSNDWRLSEGEHAVLDTAYDTLLKCATILRAAQCEAEPVCECLMCLAEGDNSPHRRRTALAAPPSRSDDAESETVREQVAIRAAQIDERWRQAMRELRDLSIDEGNKAIERRCFDLIMFGPDPGTVAVASAQYRADYSLLTPEEIAQPDPDLDELYANSTPISSTDRGGAS